MLENFSRKNDRLDDLWISIIEEKGAECGEFNCFVKKFLILSHGNADLESGFSVNRECLMENQHEESLIAERQVYDSLTDASGVEKLNITKSMILAARNSHARYVEFMEEK